MRRYKHLTGLIILIMLMNTGFVSAKKQITIYFEDGEHITVNDYKIKRGSIITYNAHYNKAKILYIRKKGRVFVVNYKTGSLIKLSKRYNFDEPQLSDLAIVYATKYYNIKAYAPQLSDPLEKHLQNEDFKKLYDEHARSARNSDADTYVLIGIILLAQLLFS
ncbi:MAG: hypothetical protein K9I94_00240 [Bacteroidales bacterium]|nr:hypothetical protein [Bacteroidales bacterium]